MPSNCNSLVLIRLLFQWNVSSVRSEVFHDSLRLLVRRTVAVVVTAGFVRHDFDALLNQPIEALLKRRVHVRNSGRKACGIEGITVDRHFPLFGKAVLFALSNVLFHSLEC